VDSILTSVSRMDDRRMTRLRETSFYGRLVQQNQPSRAAVVSTKQKASLVAREKEIAQANKAPTSQLAVPTSSPASPITPAPSLNERVAKTTHQRLAVQSEPAALAQEERQYSTNVATSENQHKTIDATEPADFKKEIKVKTGGTTDTETRPNSRLSELLKMNDAAYSIAPSESLFKLVRKEEQVQMNLLNEASLAESILYDNQGATASHYCVKELYSPKASKSLKRPSYLHLKYRNTDCSNQREIEKQARNKARHLRQSTVAQQHQANVSIVTSSSTSSMRRANLSKPKQALTNTKPSRGAQIFADSIDDDANEPPNNRHHRRSKHPAYDESTIDSSFYAADDKKSPYESNIRKETTYKSTTKSHKLMRQAALSYTQDDSLETSRERSYQNRNQDDRHHKNHHKHDESLSHTHSSLLSTTLESKQNLNTSSHIPRTTHHKTRSLHKKQQARKASCSSECMATMSQTNDESHLYCDHPDTSTVLTSSYASHSDYPTTSNLQNSNERAQPSKQRDASRVRSNPTQSLRAHSRKHEISVDSLSTAAIDDSTLDASVMLPDLSYRHIDTSQQLFNESKGLLSIIGKEEQTPNKTKPSRDRMINLDHSEEIQQVIDCLVKDERTDKRYRTNLTIE